MTREVFAVLFKLAGATLSSTQMAMYAVGNTHSSLLVWSAGPVKATHRQADPRQLVSIASTLEAAVNAHMNHHTTSHALFSTVPVSRSAPSDSAAAAVPGAAAVLHGLDSTAMAASFGCAAHLLQTHRKLKRFLSTSQRKGEEALQGLNPTGAMSCATSTADGLLLASRSHHASAAGELQQAIETETGNDGDKDGHVGVSEDAEVAQGVTGQVEWLTNILKLPWQVQPAGMPMESGR